MMDNDIEVGREVFTEDGRKAEYAGEIGGQKFVRIILSAEDEDCGLSEWASEKLTPVHRVFRTAPMETLDKRVSEAESRLAAIREEEAHARSAIQKIKSEEKALQAAAEKFPDIRMALDFLEGRITHVVIEQYDMIQIVPLHEALTNYEEAWGRRTENGMKLLCLFGHEKGKKPRWAINRYSDGSGTYTTVDPFRSEEDARAEVQRRADVAFDMWRSGEKIHHLGRFLRSCAKIPQDYLSHIAAEKNRLASDRIAKLRAEIAEIEKTNPPVFEARDA